MLYHALHLYLNSYWVTRRSFVLSFVPHDMRNMRKILLFHSPLIIKYR
jgi:hypothetical protein